MRHVIDENTAVIIFVTLNKGGDPRRAEGSEPTERYSYLIEYRDSAGALRESETQSGFISPDHCITDARQSIELDELDMEPEEKPAPSEPHITVNYHHHVCKVGCTLHRCVNPECMSGGEFPQRIANVICPNCKATTGSINDRLWMKVTTLMPLESEQSRAA